MDTRIGKIPNRKRYYKTDSYYNDSCYTPRTSFADDFGRRPFHDAGKKLAALVL